MNSAPSPNGNIAVPAVAYTQHLHFTPCTNESLRIRTCWQTTARNIYQTVNIPQFSLAT